VVGVSIAAGMEQFIGITRIKENGQILQSLFVLSVIVPPIPCFWFSSGLGLLGNTRNGLNGERQLTFTYRLKKKANIVGGKGEKDG